MPKEKDSQAGSDPKEQRTDDEFIGEFSRISQESILKQYEAKHRERIAGASLIVRDAFDKQWMKLTSRSYYQPVTTSTPGYIPGRNNTERSDPRSMNYRDKLWFSEIHWQKLPRRKISGKFKDLFTVSGVEKETEDKRPMFQNLDKDRLGSLFGMDIRDQIINDSKKFDHGTVEKDVEVDVEGYWEVIFSPQTGTNDTKDVQLMWEGQCLLIQRMQHVVLPGFYIEIADNSIRDHYTQDERQGRKKVGEIQQYPYTVLRKATRQEYLQQKASGDKIQREKMLREENA